MTLRIIDIHTHIFPDELAEKTVKYLAEEANIQSYLNGTAADLENSMKSAQISLSVNQPIATKPSQVQSINNWAKKIESDHIISFGTIHPHFEDFVEEIKRIKDLGIKGVKIHPDYQNFYVDDESVFPLYECLERNNMIILFHAGVDIGLYPPAHATPERLSRVIDAFPKLKVIAAHLGGFDSWDDVEKYLLGKNIFFDTAYVIDYMDRDKMVRIMKEHGFDKILFATDSPWKSQYDEVKKITSLPIPARVKEDILFENACHLLNI
ncbi:MAG: amidohydrolase family protein [bacterium]